MSRRQHIHRDIYLDVRSAFLPQRDATRSKYYNVELLETNITYLQPLFNLLLQTPMVHYTLQLFYRPTEMLCKQTGQYYVHPLNHQAYAVDELKEHFKQTLQASIRSHNNRFTVSSRCLPVTTERRSKTNNTVLRTAQFAFNATALCISPDSYYLDAARASGCAVCRTYEGGELNSEDTQAVYAAHQDHQIIPMLLSMDVDDTLLLRAASEFANALAPTPTQDKIILNTNMIEFLKQIKERLPTIKFSYQALTARPSTDIKWHMTQTAPEMINTFVRDFQSAVDNKYRLFQSARQNVQGSTQWECTDRESFESISSESESTSASLEHDMFDIARERNQFNALMNGTRIKAREARFYDWCLLPNIIEKAKTQLGLASLPTICTGSPYHKIPVLCNEQKTQDISIVHFDDEPVVIDAVRQLQEPRIRVVQIYRPGELEKNYDSVIQTWLGSSVSVSHTSPLRTHSLDDVFESGTFHRMLTNNEHDTVRFFSYSNSKPSKNSCFLETDLGDSDCSIT